MLPARFELHKPATLEAALELLERHGDEATPYAGGTELLIAMKARVVRFPHVVDIKRVAELKGVRVRADGGLSLGALCTHHELANHPAVRERLPGYAQLSGNIANVRVRVAGTVGGNLCFAEPHADPPAMLAALDAQLRLRGPRGERTVAADAFIVGELSTARSDDELLVAIDVPALRAGARACYRSAGHLERPAVGVAAVALPSDSGYTWRLRAGSLCGRPTAFARSEAAMNGLAAGDVLAALESHVEEDAAHIEAHDDLQGSADYKRHLACVLARRTARVALGLPEKH